MSVIANYLFVCYRRYVTEEYIELAYFEQLHCGHIISNNSFSVFCFSFCCWNVTIYKRNREKKMGQTGNCFSWKWYGNMMKWNFVLMMKIQPHRQLYIGTHNNRKNKNYFCGIECICIASNKIMFEFVSFTWPFSKFLHQNQCDNSFVLYISLFLFVLLLSSYNFQQVLFLIFEWNCDISLLFKFQLICKLLY